MLELMKSGFVLIIGLGFFYLFGQNYNFLIKKKSDIWTTLGMGFFVYYGMFQLVALPCIFTKQSLTLLTILWGIVIAIMIALGIFQLIKRPKNSTKLGERFTEVKDFFWNEKMYFLVVALVLVQCFVAASSSYVGWDTAYYIGNINTTLYTDTMYIYNGTTGLPEWTMPIRYALSSFYMNTAVWCRYFGLEAILAQKYVMAIICQLMTNLFAYLVLRKLCSSKKKIAWTMCIYMVCNYMFSTTYSTAGFLLERGYEAKAFCANVLVLAVFYGYLNLRKNVKEKKKWIDFFTILAATIPVSMSGIVSIPVLAFVLLVLLFFEHPSFRVVRNGVICLIPNGIYLIIYLLHALGVLRL